MNIIIRDDGYVNLTQLCKVGNKEFSNWYKNKNTKIFLNFLSEKLQIDIENLVKYENGENKIRATYGHPLVATNIAQWISCEFSVNVSIWIEEWKKFNNNVEIYNDTIKNIKGDNFKNNKEETIQLRLQKELGGEIEVRTEDGFIDLLTETEIIEIKEGKEWKDALGQILIYSIEYPKHKKRIHLFDIEPNINIENKCRKYDIKVTYEI